jgi:phenylalanyl-tRNA synthetase alpha chain
MKLDLTEQILQHIQDNGDTDTLELSSILKEDHQKIIGAVNSILAHGALLNSETKSTKVLEVTDEGKYVIEHGSHEACVFYAIPVEQGISQPDLMKVCCIYFFFLVTQNY